MADNQWIPDRTVDFAVQVDGQRLEGAVTVQLPTIKYVTEDLLVSGMSGHIDVPLIGVLEAMTVEITNSTVPMNHWGLLDTSSPHSLTLRTALQGINKSTNAVIPRKWVLEMHVLPGGMDMGAVKPNDRTENKVTFGVSALKITHSGQVVTDIDIFNGRLIINGKDMRAEINSILNG